MGSHEYMRLFGVVWLFCVDDGEYLTENMCQFLFVARSGVPEEDLDKPRQRSLVVVLAGFGAKRFGASCFRYCILYVFLCSCRMSNRGVCVCGLIRGLTAVLRLTCIVHVVFHHTLVPYGMRTRSLA